MSTSSIFDFTNYFRTIVIVLVKISLHFYNMYHDFVVAAFIILVIICRSLMNSRDRWNWYPAFDEDQHISQEIIRAPHLTDLWRKLGGAKLPDGVHAANIVQ